MMVGGVGESGQGICGESDIYRVIRHRCLFVCIPALITAPILCDCFVFLDSRNLSLNIPTEKRSNCINVPNRCNGSPGRKCLLCACKIILFGYAGQSPRRRKESTIEDALYNKLLALGSSRNGMVLRAAKQNLYSLRMLLERNGACVRCVANHRVLKRFRVGHLYVSICRTHTRTQSTRH